MANDHAAIIRQHDFDPTQCPRFRPQGWRIFRCFKAGPVLRRAAGRRFASNDRLGKDHRAAVPGEPPFARQTSPREQLARRQTMTPRCRRYHPAAILALGNDPLLLLKRPTPPGARRNHFKPRDLRNRRMVSHTPMSSRHPVPARWASPDAYRDIRVGKFSSVLRSTCPHTRHRSCQFVRRRLMFAGYGDSFCRREVWAR